MSYENPLLSLETDIRHSVASGNYAEAGALVTRYTQELEENLRARPVEDPQTSEMMHQAVGLLNWVKRLTQAQRAHAALEIQQLPNVAPFRTPGVRRLNTWLLNG